MPTGAENAEIVRWFSSQGQYADAYRHIASQIREDTKWNQKLPGWFEAAAEINGGSSDSFLRNWVFTSNAVAAKLDPESPEALRRNQDISNALARAVLEDYARAVENDRQLSPQAIYRHDVGVAVQGFGIPPWLWAGGPLGDYLYDFPVWENLDSLEEIDGWLTNALITAAELSDYFAEEVVDFFGDIYDAMADSLGNFSDQTKNLFNELKDLLARMLADPIVLDLDGDGIELTTLESSTTMFDLDQDGALERVAWVSPHDGLLVHDQNHNGLVDGVVELFGSANVDGYDELATIDANNDGKIDALDPAFADLMVWRDINSDGLATTDELQGMSGAGIARLNLAHAQVNTATLGNIIARKGEYERADGTRRAMASVQFALEESANLAVIPGGATLGGLPALPRLSGTTSLPDLTTAMYLDPVLKAMVEDLVYNSRSVNTFLEFQQGGFLDILYRWAGIDTSIPLNQDDTPYNIQALEKFLGRPFAALSPLQLEQVEAFWPRLVRQLGVSFLIQASKSPLLKPFYELEAALSALSPTDANFSSSVSTSIQAAVSARASAAPAYEYLDLFSDLNLNLVTGEVSGDFDAFVGKFIDDQPPFITTSAGMGGTGGTGTGSWGMWYKDQGSLLFNIAQSMGIGSEYVGNVTGWRWMFGEMTKHQGTLANDLIETTITYYERTDGVSGPGGSTSIVVQVPTTDQMVFGLEGNDEIRTNDGVDRLIGGPGDDLLKGGSGSDMYIYATGDGLDRIVDDSGGADTIYFSNELNSADLRVSRITGTDDLLLHFGDTAKGIVLTTQWSSPSAAIEQFHFVAEDGLDAGDIASLYLATLATSGADTIAGSWSSERIIGLDGDDSLSGLDGDDVLDGGPGNDTLNGGNGNDAAAGGVGNDVIDAGSGHDTLNGGAGNDSLRGEADRDTYIYNIGDGDDVIYDFDYWGRDNVVDTLIFGAGIAPSDLVLSRVAADWNDVRIGFVGRAGSILLDDQKMPQSGIEAVKFADGTVWNHAQLMARYVTDQQTPGDDTIWGSDLNDVVQAGAGNDTVAGGDGSDTLNGGTGNDSLRGDAGADTYIYNIGDGEDVINDYDYWGRDNLVDTLMFGQGITPADLILSKVATDWNDVRISFVGRAGSILLDDQKMPQSGIEAVNFSDGTVWTHAQLMARYVVDQQTSGDDIIWGSDLNDVVQAGAGNDDVSASDGHDTLNGGTGNDSLRGDAGWDTYVYNMGDGDDVIHDYDYWGKDDVIDTLTFGAGITPADLVLSRVAADWTDVRISFVGQAGSILLDGQNTAQSGIEAVKFADGTTWTNAQIAARYVADQQTSGDDTIWGTNLHDVLQGGAGNDILSAADGNDTLNGGTGNDISWEDAGDDTYIWNLGDGDDVIRGGGWWDGFNTLAFGPGIAPADIVYSYSGENIRIAVAGHPGSVTLEGQRYSQHGIDQFRFSNGMTMTRASLIPANAPPKLQQPIADVVWQAAVAQQLTLASSTFSDVDGDRLTLSASLSDGSPLPSWLSFDAASSTFSGAAPSGTAALAIRVTASDGQGNASDVFNLGVATYESTIYGTAGDDRLTGGAGDDLLDGGAGNDRLIGGAGADRLVGGDGFDWADYTTSGGPLVIDFYNGSRTTGDAVGDTYVGIESYVGTSYGDTFIAGATATIFDGGTSSFSIADTADFSLSTSAITLTLTADGAGFVQGSGAGGLAEGDGIWSIERFIGTSHDDVYTITGSGSNIPVFVEATNGGTDEVRTDGSSYVLGSEIEKLTYVGTGSFKGTGNDLNNILTGGVGNDRLIGGAGADRLVGGDGFDWADYTTSGGPLVIDFYNGSRTTGDAVGDTYVGIESYVGTSYGDTFIAGATATIFDGGTSSFHIADTADFSLSTSGITLTLTADNYGLVEGTGAGGLAAGDGIYSIERFIGTSYDDVYTITGTHYADSVAFIEEANSGQDEVRTDRSSYVLGSNIEKLTFLGTGYFTGTGNVLDNVLTGGTGDDRMIGGAGADRLVGGSGIDVAVFAGVQSDYSIVTNGGAIQVIDNQPTVDGDDGTDTLLGVERVEFKDGVQVSLAAPLVLDVDGDGIELVSAADSRARFDMDGDGKADDTSWFGAGDALLFLDRDGNGRLSDAKEFSFVDDLVGARSDMEGLRAFDSNRDGRLSSTDDRFKDFHLWQDRNGDGIAAAGEISTLFAAEVAAISLIGVPTSLVVSSGDAVAVNTGTFTKADGSSGALADAVLTYFPGGAAAQPSRLSRRDFDGSARYGAAEVGKGSRMLNDDRHGDGRWDFGRRVFATSGYTFLEPAMLAPVDVQEADVTASRIASSAVAQLHVDGTATGRAGDASRHNQMHSLEPMAGPDFDQLRGGASTSSSNSTRGAAILLEKTPANLRAAVTAEGLVRVFARKLHLQNSPDIGEVGVGASQVFAQQLVEALSSFGPKTGDILHDLSQIDRAAGDLHWHLDRGGKYLH